MVFALFRILRSYRDTKFAYFRDYRQTSTIPYRHSPGGIRKSEIPHFRPENFGPIKNKISYQNTFIFDLKDIFINRVNFSNSTVIWSIRQFDFVRLLADVKHVTVALAI